MRKFISILSAAALAASVIVVPMTASAEVGDILISQNFDDPDNTTPWGEAIAAANNTVSNGYIDSTTLENVPDAVTGNVFNFASDQGNNSPTRVVTLDGETGDAAAYNMSFDAYIKNAFTDSYAAVTESVADKDPAHTYYRFGFGGGSQATDVIEFYVQGGDIYIVSNGENIDTGIDTGDNGIWVNVSVFADVETKTINGTITPYGGEAYTIADKTPMAGANAGVVTSLYCASIRYDGSHKGYFNNYIDNFVVTESQPLETEKYNYTLKAVDANDAELGIISEGMVIADTEITAYADYAIIADGKYYTANETTKTFTVTEEGQVETIKYTEVDGSGHLYDFADGSAAFTAAGHMSATVTDEVLSLKADSSTNASKLATATLNVSSYTQNYSNIVINYDSNITKNGRFLFSMFEDTYSSYTDTGLFSQGYEKNGYYVNTSTNTKSAGEGVWTHTTLKLDFNAGTASYTVTNKETGDLIDSGSKTITAQSLKNIIAVGYTANAEGSFDNIAVIGTGDAITLEPETASTVAGSDVKITGDIDIISTLGDMSAAEDSTAEVLNHATAKAAKAGSVSMYTDKNIKNNAYYAVFDVNLTPSSKISLQPVGSSDVSTQFVLSADAQGEITVSWIGAKDVETKSADKLVHGTWYRVLLEVPQTSAGGTDPYNFYVYRINTDDPTQVSEVAAQFNSVAVRNISGKGVTKMSVAVTGDVYIDNGTIVTAAQGEDLLPEVDTRTAIADYNFENDINPFTLAAAERGVLSVVSSEDDAIVTSGKALKFAADSSAGESVKEIAKFDYSADAAGAQSVTISFDSYIADSSSYRALIKNLSSDDTEYMTQGRNKEAYYVINGSTGGAYTSASGAWVNTVIDVDLDTGKATYTLYNAEGTQLTTGSKTVDANKAGKIQLELTSPSSVIYIDNLSIKAQFPEAAELTDSTFTDNAHALTTAVDGSTAPLEYDGTIVSFTSDSATGASAAAKSTYDISAITAGKSDITISYDSYISGGRVTVGVDDLFSQGRNKDATYVINGTAGSGYTGANGVWVHTVLNIDLNNGKETYTLTWGEDGKYSSSKNIDASEVKAIVFNSTAANDAAYISNIKVTALGTYIPKPTDTWTKYTVTYNTDGSLGTVTMETVDDPSVVDVSGNTETSKVFVWNQDMKPYAAE